MTLLPPLKHITSFGLAKLPQLAKLKIVDPQPPAASIVSEIQPLVLTHEAILLQIGTGLRQWREHYGLSIDDLSARSQIQPRLIQAIETANIDILPEAVYVKGIIKRYGDSLGLDGRAIAEHLPTWQRAEEKVSFTQQSTRQTSFSSPIRFKPLHVYFCYSLLIIGSGAGISHLLNNAFKPKPALILPTVPAVTVPKAIPLATAKVVPPQNVNIGITVKEPVWAQIGIDGITKVTGSLKVGTQFNWVGTKQITISTNNAGALLLSRDKQPAQSVGKSGEKRQVTIKIGK